MKKVKTLSSWRRIAMVSWQKSKSPNVYGFMEVDMEEALKYLGQYREKHNRKITITHYMTKAIGQALEKHPYVNSCIRWGRIYEREKVDIFLQVSLDEGKDLSGAKIENIQAKSLAQIAEELAIKAEMIRSHRDPQFKKTMTMMKRLPLFLLKMAVKITDFVGNTLLWSLPSLGIPRDPFGSAMISSIGTLGIDVGFAPIPTFSRTPLVVLVGKVADRPRVVEGKVVPRKTVLLAATIDHRLVDGYQIGCFIKDLKAFIEHPSDEIYEGLEKHKEEEKD